MKQLQHLSGVAVFDTKGNCLKGLCATGLMQEKAAVGKVGKNDQHQSCGRKLGGLCSLCSVLWFWEMIFTNSNKSLGGNFEAQCPNN